MMEDSKLKSQKQGDGSSIGWRDRHEFLKRGGPCKELYMDFEESVNVPNKSSRECYKNLDMCMKTHSDYYHPLLEADKAMAKDVGDRIMKDIMHSNTPIDELNDEEEDKVIATMIEKAGCCKESVTEFAANCVVMSDDEEADQFSISHKKNEQLTCHELFERVCNCIEAHPHHPFLALKKASEENFEKNYGALFSEPK